MSYDDLLGNDEDKGIKKNLGFKEKGVTYVAIIGDHSGSMSELLEGKSKADLAMSNFNEQIATLKQEADEGMEVLATIIDFDNELICQHENVDINEVQPLKDYWTRGTTSLYDAIAYGITKIQSKFDKDSRENKAAIVIIETDGYENASEDYGIHADGLERLKKLIKGLEDTGKWTFTFLGAGLDEKFAMSMGFSVGNTVVPQGLGDTQNAYYVANAGLKTFMGSRKRGVMQSKSFYTDASDKNWNVNNGSTTGDKNWNVNNGSTGDPDKKGSGDPE
jgi:hypothetical protein